MKKLRYLAVFLATMFIFAGCSVIKVNPERDGQQVVAEVNGEKITKKEVYDYIGLTWDKKIESWDVDTVKQQKEAGLADLITEKVLIQEAKKQNMYTFTADQQKTIDEYVSTATKSTYDEALKKYQEQAKTDASIKPEEKANADVDAYLKSLGYTRDSLKQSKADSVAVENLKKSVSDKVTVSDDEVKKAYDTEVTNQTATYDKTPTQAVSDENNGTTLVYYPDGMFRVRQILIPLPDDIQSQISTLRQKKTNEATAEADKLRADALKNIEAIANEYFAKAKDANGDLTKLDKLIVDSGNKDPGMDSRKDGYLMCKDVTSYVKEFTDASLALTEVGKPSAPVGTDYGYHIIWISKKLTKGAVPFDDIKDKVKEIVLSSKQSTEWNNSMKKWTDDYASVTKKYISRLHN